MECIYKDNLIVFICGVLGNPVTVQYTKSTQFSTNTFLSQRLEIAYWLQLVHTVTLGFAICSTLGHRPFAATTTHTNAVDNVTLLGLVSQPASLLRSGWPGCPVDLVQMSTGRQIYLTYQCAG